MRGACKRAQQEEFPRLKQWYTFTFTTLELVFDRRSTDSTIRLSQLCAIGRLQYNLRLVVGNLTLSLVILSQIGSNTRLCAAESYKAV